MPIILYLFLSAVSMRFFIFRIKFLSHHKWLRKNVILSNRGTPAQVTICTFKRLVIPSMFRGTPAVITTRSPGATMSICLAQSIA